MSEKKIKLYYKYLPKDNKVLENTSYYDGLCIGGQMGSWLKLRISEYIKKNKKPFFIEPETIVFQFKRKKTRASINLGKISGDFFNQLVEEERILDFSYFKLQENWNEKRINKFVENIINFQIEYLRESIVPLQKYFKILGKKHNSFDNEPEFLVPPYFYWESFDDDWFKLSKKLAIVALNRYKKDIFPVLCFSKELLLTNLNKFLVNYNEFPGVLLYIPNFNTLHNEIIDNYIEPLIKLIKIFKQNEKKVILLYGGSFSIYFSKIGLDGTVFGIYHSEIKKIQTTYEGGGGVQMYYIPSLNKNFGKGKAAAFISLSPILKCNCSVCKSKEVDQMDFQECSKHFLLSKKNLQDRINSSNFKEIIEKSEDNYNKLERIIKNYTKYFLKWMRILKKM
ncbi:MAG: hypothetical protein ACTSVV_13155 [Promethearchaeota archaeon]